MWLSLHDPPLVRLFMVVHDEVVHGYAHMVRLFMVRAQMPALRTIYDKSGTHSLSKAEADCIVRVKPKQVSLPSIG